MRTFPLQEITLEEAKELQFRLIDEITHVFAGSEILNRGNLGIVEGTLKPGMTAKVEQVIARFFGAEACMLVRGAGTMAIRMALSAATQPDDSILIHAAPVYPTTQTSIEWLGLQPVQADYNCGDELQRVLETHDHLSAVIIQHSRQQMEDRYHTGEVIQQIKAYRPNLPIITDDNYAVMKVRQIGCEHGADLSCFSLFKLLGAEGIGCIVGKSKWIQTLEKQNYSGGMQVTGEEALECLRGLVYAPVSIAIQAEENEKVLQRLLAGEIPEVKQAFSANSQSKVVLVEFHQPIAQEVLREAGKLGAAPYPVGAESKYELVPLFYKVSGTFLEQDPTLLQRMIRINPMRSGTGTVMRILQEAIANVCARQ